jgi:GGDEF domain-containing protein
MAAVIDKFEISLDLERFHVRRSAVVELMLFFTIALVLDYVLFDGTRYRDISPHPFWLPVLLLSVQYGTSAGLVAAATASSVLLIANLPPQSLIQDFYEYMYEVSLNPLMWFMAAVLFGELRMRHVRERDALRGVLAKAKQQNEVTTQAYQTLKEANSKLMVQIAGQVKTVNMTLPAIQLINKMELDEIIEGCIEAVQRIINPEKFSLFLLDNNQFKIEFAYGWSRNDEYSHFFLQDSALFQTIVGEHRFLCITDALDERIFNSEGVLAGPLYNSATGEVFGMLKIEGLSFLDLELSTVETFNILCEMIGTTMDHAKQFQRASSDRYIDRKSNLFTQNFFEDQIKNMNQLCKRSGMETSVLRVFCGQVPILKAADRSELNACVGKAVSEELRSTEMVFDCNDRGEGFTVILPATPVKDCHIIVEKLVPAIRRILPRHLKGLSIEIVGERLQDQSKSKQKKQFA